MKKRFILTLFLISIQSTLAAEGIILTLEAPLLREPDLNSKVVQLIPKGEKIYLHDKHVMPSEATIDGKLIKIKDDIGDETFYETIDRLGNRVYIEKKYVKIVYEDQRENFELISPFEHDPRDYRLEEPLPKAYPLPAERIRRAFVGFQFNSEREQSYAYRDQFSQNDFGLEKGLLMKYLWNAKYDHYNRSFYGALVGLSSRSNVFTFTNNSSAKESELKLTLGPMMSYDFYRSQKYLATVEFALPVSYYRTLVNRNNGSGLTEERFFTGYGLGSLFALSMTKRKFISDIDLVFGSQLQLALSQTLRSNTPVRFNSLWNQSNDTITRPFGANYGIFLALQSDY